VTISLGNVKKSLSYSGVVLSPEYWRDKDFLSFPREITEKSLKVTISLGNVKKSLSYSGVVLSTEYWRDKDFLSFPREITEKS
jgi:hypothetical protein